MVWTVVMTSSCRSLSSSSCFIPSMLSFVSGVSGCMVVTVMHLSVSPFHTPVPCAVILAPLTLNMSSVYRMCSCAVFVAM